MAEEMRWEGRGGREARTGAKAVETVRGARILRTPSEVRNALVYGLQNARKHGAWVARFADVDSSAPAFEGWRERRNPAESSVGVRAGARTWLLRVGWRRLGLIGLFELPRGAVEARAARVGA